MGPNRPEAGMSMFWRYFAFSVWWAGSLDNSILHCFLWCWACLHLLLYRLKGPKRWEVCMSAIWRYSNMSPYKFTSKTHSLSTEDLEIFFIDWLIYLSTLWEHFTINRKWARKSWIISRKSEENEQKIWMIFVVAIVFKGLCSGFRVHI